MKITSDIFFAMGIIGAIGFFLYNIAINMIVDLGIGILIVSQFFCFIAIFLAITSKEEKPHE
jgi:site-specific recombinase